MNNTLKNKAAFFAQHWGQKIMKMTVNENDFLQTVGFTYMNKYKVENCHIELKSLSIISDEDALRVAEIFDLDKLQIEDTNLIEWIEAMYNEASGYYIDGYTGNQLLSGSDLLRSEGYALPWMGLSVEAMIEYGWIKLKTD